MAVDFLSQDEVDSILKGATTDSVISFSASISNNLSNLRSEADALQLELSDRLAKIEILEKILMECGKL